jgi:hypothetical protein
LLKKKKKKKIASVGLTALSKNAMYEKVLAKKVLGFRSVIVTPLTFLETNLVAPWIIQFTPLAFSFWLNFSQKRKKKKKLVKFVGYLHANE